MINHDLRKFWHKEIELDPWNAGNLICDKLEREADREEILLSSRFYNLVQREFPVLIHITEAEALDSVKHSNLYYMQDNGALTNLITEVTNVEFYETTGVTLYEFTLFTPASVPVASGTYEEE